MLQEFIHTRNYTLIREAITRLQELPESAPKMGLLRGSHGLGKSFMCAKIQSETNAILLRALQVWSKKGLLRELCEELDIEASGDAGQMYKRVTNELANESRILIIDEIDALLRSQKFEVLELLRDLHDQTKTIVMMVGMEESNAKLKRHSHFRSRIVEFVEFKPVDLDDIKKYRKLSNKVKIEDDLCEYFAKKCPNLRQIYVLLTRIENAAKRNNIIACDLNTYKSLKVEEESA
jgi:DNA transposition AAA+ family ATPase